MKIVMSLVIWVALAVGGGFCEAVSVSDMSLAPRWKTLNGSTNEEVCVMRELSTIKVVGAGVNGILVDWACLEERYTRRYSLGWTRELAAEKDRNSSRLEMSQMDYFRLEDKNEGSCPRGRDVMASFGGKMAGMMEVGYGELRTTGAHGHTCPEWALKHSVYVATNNMIGCVLRFVSCNKTSQDVYLGTWLVRCRDDGDLAFLIRTDGREDLYTNTVTDKNGNICVYVGRDEMTGCYVMRKDLVREYCRILKASRCLRAGESRPVDGAGKIPRQILGAEVMMDAISTEGLEESQYCTARGVSHVWIDVSSGKLVEGAQFNTVKRLYDFEARTLRAMEFQCEFASGVRWKECRAALMDVSNRIFNDLGVFLDFGKSLHEVESELQFAVSGSGRRRDGVSVSLALSKADRTTPAKMIVLVEIACIE